MSSKEEDRSGSSSGVNESGNNCDCGGDGNGRFPSAGEEDNSEDERERWV